MCRPRGGLWLSAARYKTQVPKAASSCGQMRRHGFNGDISAPDGFAEVSGKQTLASVHLAGIDVGELLLDPVSITIDTTGTTTLMASPNGDIAATDTPSENLTLAVGQINAYAGDLSLAATNTIMVNVAISKMTGDLTLIAGGVLTLGANITTSAGDLALTGASIALSGAATLTGAAITITAPTIDIGADRALTITASGALTLATVGMITGMGTAALSLEGDTIAGLSTALTLDVPTVSLELTIASTVDPGGRVLVPGSSFGATAPFAANSMIGTLNINTQAEQEYHSWMAATNRNLSIDSRFRITIGVAEINLGNGDLTLSSPEIDYTHASGLTIRVGDFSHSGTFQTRFADFISTPLLVFANGNITLETIFSLSDRLELRADADGDGMGMITSSSSFRLDAGSLFLQHAGAAFAADLFTTASRVTGAATFLITGMGVDQTIHPWMTALGGTSFSLAGEGVVLTSITLPAAADFGATAIDLQATDITLGGDLTAGAVILRADTIAGDDDGLVAITITTGTLTTTDITDMGEAGTGVPATADSVTSFSLMQSDAFGSAAPFTFGMGLTLTLQTAAMAQTVQSWMVADGRDLSLTSTGGDITIGGDIDVGTGNLTLIASGNIAAGTSVVTADTVSLELTGSDSFGATAPFAVASMIGTLNLNTQAAADLSRMDGGHRPQSES